MFSWKVCLYFKYIKIIVKGIICIRGEDSKKNLYDFLKKWMYKMFKEVFWDF